MYGRTDLLKNATTTATGDSVAMTSKDNWADNTFQAVGSTTAGSGAAAINIEVSNDNENWIVMGTISLTLGTSKTTDGFASNAAWQYTRARITSISGTGASVSVIMGS